MNILIVRSLWLVAVFTLMFSGFLGAADLSIGEVEVDPNLIFILLLLGVFGLIFEAATPGIMIPGILGGVAMMIALSEMRDLPVNMSGLFIMSVGVLLILSPVFKLKLPVLSWVGVGIFTLGAVWLLMGDGLDANVPFLAGLTLASGWFFQWLVARFVNLRDTAVVTGKDGLVGRVGTVLTDFDRKGRIMIDGTSWQVSAEGSLRKGDEVRVLSAEELVLKVERV